MKPFYLLLVSLAGLAFNAHSQAISEGALLPPYGTTKALVVFAEIDYSTGGCIGNLGDFQNPLWESWPINSNGYTEAPMSIRRNANEEKRSNDLH